MTAIPIANFRKNALIKVNLTYGKGISMSEMIYLTLKGNKQELSLRVVRAMIQLVINIKMVIRSDTCLLNNYDLARKQNVSHAPFILIKSR